MNKSVLLILGLVIALSFAFSKSEEELINFSPKIDHSAQSSPEASSGPAYIKSTLTESEVFETPKFRFTSDYDDTHDYSHIKGLFLEGLEYQGHSTQVFAWYGVPETLKEGEKAPAVVLVHGGGGTAFPDWVDQWTSRGYIAIAIAHEGQLPGPKKPWYPTWEYSGPRRAGFFRDADKDLQEQWFYHAVADAILANSLLRSFPEVDDTNIGINGISWGGILTNVITGIDQRFKFSIPVYGCGYLYDSPKYSQDMKVNSEAEAQFYRKNWEPSLYIPLQKMPVFYVNGSNDKQFAMNIATRTFNSISTEKYLRIEPKMRHSSKAGYAPKEIYDFADYITQNGPAPAAISIDNLSENMLTASYEGNIESAILYYRTDTMTWVHTDYEWQEVNAQLVKDKSSITAGLPQDAQYFFINARTNDGSLFSSPMHRRADVSTPKEKIKSRVKQTKKPVNISDEKVDFYVSTKGSDNWSGKLAEPNELGTDGPFATLVRARNAVRELKKDHSKDILVWIRDGLYQIQETVLFSLEDSGHDELAITYAAYPGETPVFSSGKEIKDWEKVNTTIPNLPAEAQGNVWVANVSDRFLTLYDEEGLLPRAQSEAFFPAADKNGRNRLRFPEGKLKNWSNVTDVEIKVRPHHAWIVNMLPLDSVNEETGTATTSVDATYAMNKLHFLKETKNIWVENVLEELDKKGEWVLNTQEGKVYLWPRNESPVVAPTLFELIRVEGKIDKEGPTDIPVRNLHFKGLTFKHGERYTLKQDDAGLQHDWDMLDKDNALVRFRGTENCSIKKCHFLHSGSGAIRVDLHGMNNEISSNHIEHLGGAGILLCGYGPGTKDVNKNNLVFNNHIHHIGEIYWHSPGIFLWQSGENRVANNLVHHTDYTAMIFSGCMSNFFSKKGRELTRTIRWNELTNLPKEVGRQDVLPYLHTHDNIIEYNEIHHSMLRLGDGNAIYIRGAGEGNIIRRNYIHDMVGETMMQAAIRTDGGQTGTLISENLLYRCTSQGILTKLDNKVENNIVADIIAPPRGFYLSVREGPLTGGSIKRNIFYSSGDVPTFIDELPPGKEGSTEDRRGRRLALVKDADTDYNIYFSKTNPEKAKARIEKNQKDGIDLNSRTTDPLFVDPENGDFRFQPGSPALEMGIKPFDVSQAGLRQIEPTWESLKENYSVPDWFLDGKIGIWMHWGIPSAVDPNRPNDGSWYGRNMYGGGNKRSQEISAWHKERYGPPEEFGYEKLIPLFKAENWDPDALVAFIKDNGARFVMPVATHHDNFDMYDSFHPWNSVDMGPKRDVLKEWKDAATKHGLKFGISTHLYWSPGWWRPARKYQKEGTLEWKLFNMDYDPKNYAKQDSWNQHWYARSWEIVEKYDPDLFNHDSGPYPKELFPKFIAEYLNRDLKDNDGEQTVIFSTKNPALDREAFTYNLERGGAGEIKSIPWMWATDLSGNWFYQANVVNKMSIPVMVANAVDAISKNGVVMLNVALKGDGTIPDKQISYLTAFGDFLKINGEGIYDSRPWKTFGEGPLEVKDGRQGENHENYSQEDIRFTTRDGVLYAFVLAPPTKDMVIKTLAEGGLLEAEIDKIELMGSAEEIQWERSVDGLTIKLPKTLPGELVNGFKITIK